MKCLENIFSIFLALTLHNENFGTGVTLYLVSPLTVCLATTHLLPGLSAGNTSAFISHSVPLISLRFFRRCHQMIRGYRGSHFW